MFTRAFWRDTIERAIRTAAQFLIAQGALDPLSTDLQTALGTKLIGAGIAAVLTVLTCLAATGVGNSNSPSFTDTDTHEHGQSDLTTILLVVLIIIAIIVLVKYI